MKKVNNIVIIDDDDVSNFIYRKVIESVDVTGDITSFSNASEGLEYLQDIASSHPENFPDIIFLDINMPMMNGWQFLDNYRKLSNTNDKVIICILSSSVYQDDINKAYSYPEVKEYISKPLTGELMKNLLTKYF